MKKVTAFLFLCLFLKAGLTSAQITCREFDHDPVANTKAEMTEKKFSVEYEYSNKFANEEKNEFSLRIAADSLYNVLAVGGKSVKSCEITVFDAANVAILNQKAKGKKILYEFSPPKDGEYVIQVIVTCKNDDCTYVGVFGKPK